MLFAPFALFLICLLCARATAPPIALVAPSPAPSVLAAAAGGDGYSPAHSAAKSPAFPAASAPDPPPCTPAGTVLWW